MARRGARVPSYFEPWNAQVTRDWHKAFGDDPPPVEDPDAIERWRSARARAERDAAWIIWGSEMFEPGVSYGFIDGNPHVDDGQHIIARLTKVHSDKETYPSHGEIAQRVALCVNALQGVGNPGALITATRDFLADLVRGEADASDPRACALLARWIPTNIADVGTLEQDR